MVAKQPNKDFTKASKTFQIFLQYFSGFVKLFGMHDDIWVICDEVRSYIKLHVFWFSESMHTSLTKDLHIFLYILMHIMIYLLSLA